MGAFEHTPLIESNQPMNTIQIPESSYLDTAMHRKSPLLDGVIYLQKQIHESSLLPQCNSTLVSSSDPPHS